ncbi:MAG TPA: hypothetical protein VEZ13_12125 [Brevibacillus sp.]|nr:hypothetical protein [Brevibacillus sp.]
MEPNEIFYNWFIIHKTVDYLKEDLERSKDAPLRLPYALTESIRLIGRVAHTAEREAAKEMRAAGIRLVKEFLDQREYFAVWSNRGGTQMLRLHENVVRIQAQKKVEEITKEIVEQRAGPPQA